MDGEDGGHEGPDHGRDRERTRDAVLGEAHHGVRAPTRRDGGDGSSCGPADLRRQRGRDPERHP